ncbi:hypothetical protein E2562_021334 [Oryza meyeriana var. granulata]|uniref:Nodulin-like domain-containing protein n=1 Tax=Oryza meyeriana var. granulata TaxID=110450 RepID=A0A6G1BZB5_9ORYZ|nr:hypothetical protein E2562_021334 [Oryza meyeriana var. granulata]
MLGVANDVGENVGLVPGVLANRLPPWLILVIGSACAFLGFGTLWLAVTKTLVMPYWVLCIALCIGTNSSAWLGTAALVTNMRNFPLSRGTVAGLIKGYVALFSLVISMTKRRQSSTQTRGPFSGGCIGPVGARRPIAAETIGAAAPGDADLATGRGDSLCRWDPPRWAPGVMVRSVGTETGSEFNSEWWLDPEDGVITAGNVNAGCLGGATWGQFIPIPKVNLTRESLATWGDLWCKKISPAVTG